MRERLIRRRFLALGILFLLMTGVFAPIAYFAGLAQGRQLRAAAFQNGSEYVPYSMRAGDYSGQEIICGWNGGTRDPELEAFCHPFFEAGWHGWRAADSGTGAGPASSLQAAQAFSQSGGPLNQAVNESIAGLATNWAPGSPLSTALAPDGDTATSPRGPRPWGTAFFPGGGGFPDVFAPGFAPGAPIQDGPPFTPGPGDDGSGDNSGNSGSEGGASDSGAPLDLPTGPDPAPSDPIVTPLPGAILLWIPGAIALFGAIRRKKART